MSIESGNKVLLIRRTVFIVLVAVWMIVIFCFSAKDADQSSQQSYAVGKFFGSIVYSDFESWPDEEQQSFAEKWEYPIRKTAHMSEYALLGFLWVGVLADRKKRYKRAFAGAFLLSVLYAASDEFHQWFVPGRACMFTDVLFDSLGAFTGVVVGIVLKGFISSSGRFLRQYKR